MDRRAVGQDKQQLVPLVETIEQQSGPKPQGVVVDSGYGSEENLQYLDKRRIEGFVATEKAVTVYWKNGKVAVTDGPYAETKEQLGGIQVLEARDLNHAIQLISQCPGVKLQCGTIEIRPATDINEMMRESERRRRKDISR